MSLGGGDGGMQSPFGKQQSIRWWEMGSSTGYLLGRDKVQGWQLWNIHGVPILGGMVIQDRGAGVH